VCERSQWCRSWSTCPENDGEKGNVADHSRVPEELWVSTTLPGIRVLCKIRKNYFFNHRLTAKTKG